MVFNPSIVSISKHVIVNACEPPPRWCSIVHFLHKDNQRAWKGKYNLLRGVAARLGLSSSAKQRLEWIIFYQTVGKENASCTAKYFGISRKTLHKWLKRYDDSNLRFLEEVSRAPVKRRGWEVTPKEEEQVITLRKNTKCRYGKKKLKALYLKEYKEEISTWKIERVVRRHRLYREKEIKRAYTKAKRDKKKKILIHDIERKKEFGFIWHIDCIILWWYGRRRVIFTAIEDITKIAFARIYKTNSSQFSKDFLERLTYLVKGRVNFIHSDNGSGFEGSFKGACNLLGLTHIYSRPRTPTDNPALERFNWTLQDEWLELSEVGLDDIDAANKDLTDWLVEYNNYRPHESLDYKTPLEYAQQNFFKVLPMWSART